MGRWSQRRLAGGGPPILNYMTFATQIENDVINVRFAFPVDATTFDPSDFVSNPSGALATTYAQLQPNLLEITLNSSSAGDDEVQYVGNKSGFQPNQQIQYD